MSATQESVLARLSTEPVARLATIDPSGKPHIVPVTFAVDGESFFTMVDHKPKKTTSLQRLANIARQPSVSILVDNYEEDWTRLWWVRVDGEARVVDSGSNWSRAQRLLIAKYPQYIANPPTGPAIIVDIDRVTTWEWS